MSPIARVTGCLIVLCGLASLLGCGTSTPDDAVSAPEKRRIAVIPKGTTHVFWTSVEAGAKKAGEELGVDIIWKGPLDESDRSSQIQLMQQFVGDGVDGIVLAPLDSIALVGSVRNAAQNQVPVAIIDSGIEAEQGKDYVSFVATNNELGGKLGGEKLAEILNQMGDVVLLRYAAGSASTTNRENGFMSAMDQADGIQVISENQYAGSTAGEAQTVALNMVDVLKQANGIFCPNESSTDGMLQALRKQGLAGKVTFVGFDASPPLVEALRNGEIDALVVQNPYQMGYQGVKALVAHLDGQSVEPLIDTGVTVVTRENMELPEVAPLIN